MQRVTLVVWSDYLCPWCYNASVRLHRVEQEFAPQLRVEWRSYLLRPNPGHTRDAARFRAYTRSWRRPAAEPDGGTFSEWSGDAPPPSHSVPAHRVAKAAAQVSDGAFRRMHDRLLRAYFSENRDISDDVTLRGLWLEVGLSPADFERREEPLILEHILGEHAAALEAGATGVPAVQLVGNDAVIVGAQPLELYR
ncbi:MAG: DsbA family protein, partial [Myxococcota bacterium]|nr:DsbA family protein [Myxococcota bacterium]